MPRDPRPEPARLRAAAAVWEAGWEITRRLPEPAAFAAADLLGRAAWRLARSTRARVRRNLSRVVSAEQLDAAAREAFRSYARYWAEAFRAVDLDPEDLDRRTTVDGIEHLDGVLDEGRGAIVLLAHHGTWDVAAVWAESHGYHLSVVAEVLRPRRLFAKFVRSREAVGLDVVPLRRGKGLVERLQGTLEANHLVGLLADRDLSRRGALVRLFGEPCRLPPGPAVLARRTGAAIVPISMLQRPGRRWHLQMLEPLRIAELDIDAGMQQAAAAIERLIRLDPHQWHAFQSIWLADVPVRPGPGESGAGAGALASPGGEGERPAQTDPDGAAQTDPDGAAQTDPDGAAQTDPDGAAQKGPGGAAPEGAAG